LSLYVSLKIFLPYAWIRAIVEAIRWLCSYVVIVKADLDPRVHALSPVGITEGSLVPIAKENKHVLTNTTHAFDICHFCNEQDMKLSIDCWFDESVDRNKATNMTSSFPSENGIAGAPRKRGELRDHLRFGSALRVL